MRCGGSGSIFDAGVITIRTSIAEVNGQSWEKDTKDHQQRRNVLDPQTLGLSRALLVLRAREAEALGCTLSEGGFLFSPGPRRVYLAEAATMTRRFTRMCAGLGHDIHLHAIAAVEEDLRRPFPAAGLMLPRRSGAAGPGRGGVAGDDGCVRTGDDQAFPSVPESDAIGRGTALAE